jgi:hypothetical protein
MYQPKHQRPSQAQFNQKHKFLLDPTTTVYQSTSCLEMRFRMRVDFQQAGGNEESGRDEESDSSISEVGENLVSLDDELDLLGNLMQSKQVLKSEPVVEKAHTGLKAPKNWNRDELLEDSA